VAVGDTGENENVIRSGRNRRVAARVAGETRSNPGFDHVALIAPEAPAEQEAGTTVHGRNDEGRGQADVRGLRITTEARQSTFGTARPRAYCGPAQRWTRLGTSSALSRA